MTRSTVAEEANLAEIQRLASSAAEMQAELAFRPTRADIDDLTSVVAQLRADLDARDQLLQKLQSANRSRDKETVERSVATTPSLEDLSKIGTSIDTANISAEIDEMFRLDYEDEDDETDSAATEIDSCTAIEQGKVVDTSNTSVIGAGEYVKLDDEARLRVTLENGSLHALEEELVRVKERWAEACGDRARLAAQVAALQCKPITLLGISPTHLVALALPVLFACVCYLLLPYLS